MNIIDSARRIEAVIFDLDGTLWDARENICVSWNKVLEEHYPQVTQIALERFTPQMGRLLSDIGDDLLCELPPDERAEALRLCCEYENQYLSVHGGRLYPDEINTLRLLAEKYRLFIVSNCQEGYIEAFYSSTGLGQYFDDFECSGHTGRLKGENIRILMERNNISRAAYVGDTGLDEQAAAEAGVPFVFAAYGFGEAKHCDTTAVEFAGLPDRIRSLEESIACSQGEYKWR